MGVVFVVFMIQISGALNLARERFHCIGFSMCIMHCESKKQDT